ncbi:MAG: phosphoenolpyruvate carboxylase, partial [Aggregatilineales bacterium]
MSQPIEPHEKENSLSEDIHLLGDLLGQIIEEQHDHTALNMVEEIRRIARERRNGQADASEQLIEHIQALDVDALKILVKAFGNYFQLINIAEDAERVRVLRDREQDGNLRESLEIALNTLHDQGKTATEVRDLLNNVRLRFVLTAHPSEAKRTEVLVKLRHIAHMLRRLERENLLPREIDTLQDNLAEEIEELWQTRPIPSRQKLVADEVEFGLYFVTSVIMDAVVDIYDDIYRILEDKYPDEDWSDLARVLRYGSWIGGDRDGNPNVTTDVTMNTLATLYEAAKHVYLNDIEFLLQHLTQDTEELGASITITDDADPDVVAMPDEQYIEALHLIRHKLDDDAYIEGQALWDDLQQLQVSLQAHKSKRAAQGKLRRLLRKVRLFGMTLMPLDIREDARLHAEALDELFRHYDIINDYSSLSEVDKQKLLLREIDNPRPFFPPRLDGFKEVTQRIINTWRMIGDAHAQYGTEAIDCVIASMSEQPSDVLAMYLMAQEVTVLDDVDIVPLFETIDDLFRAPEVMAKLFEMDFYMAHLQKRGMRQQIMLGYSDSSKDGGYIASNWHLYQAQQGLADICDKYGVAVELFHGRGGSIGRGGGPTNRAIRSQPPASLKGGIKITEQGEVIAYRYGNEDIARRHLHQVMNAVILSISDMSHHQLRSEWTDAMSQLSAAGRETYRDFVYESDGFLDYWQQATPINELSQLRISSRPAKRGGKGGFAAMRAIPWVFSWMQSRAIVPSWFGVGTAFQRFCDENDNGLTILQTMYTDWLFFRALVDNTELDVAKADMGIVE